ncbi:hypothetical protein GQ600_978 [Phytophthora cactorum]|nr:hypothetical protein GQ600_978 [Phytophthora cactorum]
MYRKRGTSPICASRNSDKKWYPEDRGGLPVAYYAQERRQIQDNANCCSFRVSCRSSGGLNPEHRCSRLHADPESQFKGSANSAWIVQIDPVWRVRTGTATSLEVRCIQGSKDGQQFQGPENAHGRHVRLRCRLWLHGPNGTPQPVPTDGKATFSRAIVHVGPCEIWLDNTKVLYEDDCFSKYGNENQDIKSVFPVDYSSCDKRRLQGDAFLLAGVPGFGRQDCVAVLQRRHFAAVSVVINGSIGDSVERGKSDSPSSGNSDTPSSGESPTPAPESGDSPTQGSSAETPSAETPGSLRLHRPSAMAATSLLRIVELLPVLSEDIGCVAPMMKFYTLDTKQETDSSKSGFCRKSKVVHPELS